MKTNIILIALFVAAFMFPSIGSVDTADAETDISHCANLEATAARPACEAAAHSSMGIVAAPFDDGLMGAPAQSTGMSEFVNATDGSPNLSAGDRAGVAVDKEMHDAAKKRAAKCDYVNDPASLACKQLTGRR